MLHDLVKPGLVAGLVYVMAGPVSAQLAPAPVIETAPLAKDAFSSGTLEPATGAMPATLWDGASARTLDFLLDNLPARPATPSLGEAFHRILLSPGTAPAGDKEALGGKKLLALARAGFVEEAATIASLSSVGRGNPHVSQAEAVSSLLDGDVQDACARGQRLTSGRENPFWVKLRVLCYAQAGERDAADLTLGILRDQYGLTEADDAFLAAAAAGAAPKAPLAPETALQLAIADAFEFPLTPGLLSRADGGVLVAVANDVEKDAATRVFAAERAVAMGVLSPAHMRALMGSFEFEVADIGAAQTRAQTAPKNPLTDALLYKSIEDMAAPEFLRDKAQRIALALSLADSFPRSYALSILYADEISALEGVLLAPSEAAHFASARMAVGDSVGAAKWLMAMLGDGASIGALPEDLGVKFIDLVNLLALLDPQSAAQVARAGDVSLLGAYARPAPEAGGPGDPAAAAEILRAAFDAASEGKIGQAGLAALAASRGGGARGPSEAVIVEQSLKAAGLEDLQRRYAFELAWATQFSPEDSVTPATAEERGFAPRLKPGGGQ